ncbi:MAG TPA: maleylpyruvate isomerase N-terminal domain-containing protein, partial [Acidothermaceae bacterium]
MRVNPWADAGVACVAQWDRVADAVDALPDESFELPTALPGWRVADLVAHLSMCAGLAARWAAEPAPERIEAGVGPYLLSLAAAASAVDEGTRA